MNVIIAKRGCFLVSFVLSSNRRWIFSHYKRVNIHWTSKKRFAIGILKWIHYWIPDSISIWIIALPETRPTAVLMLPTVFTSLVRQTAWPQRVCSSFSTWIFNKDLSILYLLKVLTSCRYGCLSTLQVGKSLVLDYHLNSNVSTPYILYDTQ